MAQVAYIQSMRIGSRPNKFAFHRKPTANRIDYRSIHRNYFYPMFKCLEANQTRIRFSEWEKKGADTRSCKKKGKHFSPSATFLMSDQHTLPMKLFVQALTRISFFFHLLAWMYPAQSPPTFDFDKFVVIYISFVSLPGPSNRQFRTFENLKRWPQPKSNFSKIEECRYLVQHYVCHICAIFYEFQRKSTRFQRNMFEHALSFIYLD